MATEQLFDYNSSFGVLRTNPKLTGNLKLTLDSTGGMWFNSMDVNPTLSLQKYKKFSITGKNTYAKDVYNFFDEGKTPTDVIFQVGNFTNGASQPADNFSSQYDFFYGSGASTLIDRNYTENFRYFQPLWIRDTLPEFFVIFKVPQPLSYPYPTNVSTVSDGIQYKVIASPNSTIPFIIKYWDNQTSKFVEYVDGEFFYGNSIYNTYTVVQGSGVVTEMNELKYLDEVNNVEEFFNSKILPNAQVISTFDLRSNTPIGAYIRSLVNNPGFSDNPIDISFQANTFSYFNGVSIKEGVLTQQGELLNSYFTSTASSSQIDFEEYITDGFSRNGIICPNLLNLEFLFNDPDSDLYTINRYMGFYVSRNDLGEFRLNGQYFYDNRNDSDNLNLPKPTRNNLGYYYNANPAYQSSTGGVRLYYEGASGWMPGSEDINVKDPQKLYYVTDKLERFYSLSRYENYVQNSTYPDGEWLNNTPDYLKFGPYYPNNQQINKAYSVLASGSQYGYVNVLTVGDHGFEDGSFVTITGSSPQINGPWRITIPSGATGNSFQIPVVLSAGTGIVTGSTGYIPGSTVNYVNPSVYTSQGASGGLIQGTTGSTDYHTGSLVIGDTKVDLLDFTGPDQKIGSYLGKIDGQKGRAYMNVTFQQTLNLANPVTFKIFWPNGSRGELNNKYDLVTSGDYAGTLTGWTSGSYYSTGDDFYFNWTQGTTTQIAKAFTGAVSDISTVVWDAATSTSASASNSDAIIRIKNPGSNQNFQYSISVFSDYPAFESNYQGTWDNTSAYSVGDIVTYNNSYYEASSAVAQNPYNTNLPPTESGDWTSYYPFEYPGYVSIGGVDASQISYIQNFVGGTDYIKNRVAFSAAESGNVIPGNWIQVQPGKGITGGMSQISSVTRYVDSPIYDNDPLAVTGTVTGFKGYQEYLVANLSDNSAIIELGSNSSFNVFNMAKLYSGVFTFFDLKTIDFDFWSSSYGVTPTPEYHRYFQLVPNQSGQIKVGVKYYVRQGQIRVERGTINERVINPGQVFIGLSSTTFEDLLLNGQNAIVLPAVFTRMGYVNSVLSSNPYNYGDSVQSEQDLNSFNGFYGIQSLFPEEIIDENIKETLFEYGKLDTEYQYLEENYTVTRANKSRIVPYINKWVYSGGTDARGNAYRLNVSPAFTPTNFSPGFQQDIPNPQYLTHEWMLLEGVPREYPASSISSQYNYLPYKINLDKIRNASPSEAGYFQSYFTVDPIDYPTIYYDKADQVKEFFTPFKYNSVTGFYDTIFRGVKISLKRRSTIPNPQSDLDKFVPNFRGFEDYKFAAILRVVPEDSTKIQAPVRYEVIENIVQKCILFVTYVVVKDYRALPLDYTGSTGGDPYLDYLLMYSLSSKKKETALGQAALPPTGLTGAAGPTGSPLYEIDSIKLSAALDLSYSSLSQCNTSSNGQIYIIPNPDYDTDLREEINLYYPAGATSILGATGASGSFTAIAGSTGTSQYPWPTGRSQNVVNFGPTNATNYYFDIPFSPSYPGPTLDIPLASQGAYKNKPVTQIAGGENYFDFIMKRISLSYIADRVNTNSPYVTYITYDYSTPTGQTIATDNYFELDFVQPTAISKTNGLAPIKSYTGPQTLGQNQPTSYEIVNGGISLASDILRYAGGYEPLFDKIIMYKNDKIDTIAGATGFDLSYRNCTFAPEKTGFGQIQNLSYTKVSLGRNILSQSQNLPQGPVYPLIGQTPIALKDFSIFLSSWDPGYYNLYTSSTTQTPVAGTRSMAEYNTFMGSKMMQTPGQVTTYTFIALEISRTTGTVDPQIVNLQAQAATAAIQSMTPATSNTGIGQLGPALSGVDLSKLDESIYPDIEVFWQNNTVTNKVSGVIRLDRIIRRYLLNSGISSVFVENIITEYGFGNPNNIQDDVRAYIEQNVIPIYEGKQIELLVLKKGKPLSPTQLLVRGDLINPDKLKYGYVSQPNFSLTQRTNLTYEFEYSLDPTQNYSLTFNFTTGKI